MINKAPHLTCRELFYVKIHVNHLSDKTHVLDSSSHQGNWRYGKSHPSHANGWKLTIGAEEDVEDGHKK